MDNTVLSPGVGGNTIRDEDVGGVHYPVAKLVLGNAGVDDGDVSATNPMPVVGVVAIGGGTVDQGAPGAAPWVTKDDYTLDPEVLPDQAGAGAVLTFTFANPVVFVLLEASGASITARVTLGAAQTPTAALGVRVTDEKVYLPCPPLTHSSPRW